MINHNRSPQVGLKADINRGDKNVRFGPAPDIALSQEVKRRRIARAARSSLQAARGMQRYGQGKFADTTSTRRESRPTYRLVDALPCIYLKFYVIWIICGEVILPEKIR